MPARVDLPDVNFWLATSVADHAHHAQAKAYWINESSDSVAFCRITAMGFLRLITNTHVMAGSPFSVPEAWRAYLALCQTPEIVLAPEPPNCDIEMDRLVLGGGFSPKLWTDAYLAAFAISVGMRLVSFDSDFGRFHGLDFLQI